jgi:hypothetical protein
MANEIQFPIGEPGLTGLYCRPLAGSTLGTSIALTELSGAGGLYRNNGTITLTNGTYTLLAFDSTAVNIGYVGPVVWDGIDFSNAGFTGADRTTLAATKAAAEAVADGRHAIDYQASTATQFNADGTPRTVFDLLKSDGSPATSGQDAVERVPR